MNIPPRTFVAVPHAHLRSLSRALGVAAGLPDDRATFLADVLVDNDLRGVFSHGSMQMATYARLFRDGKLNPRPELSVPREGPGHVLVDGDGSLGYFASWDMTGRVIEKALAGGIAIGLTRNHGHFGAAGIYARRTLPHGLLCFVTSGHQLHLHPGGQLATAGGGSPMAFTAPGLEEPPMVLDFGTMHDLYPGEPHAEAIGRLAPGMVFRALGLAAVCQSWGGFLAGVPSHPDRARRAWEGANQGSMVIAFRIDCFADPEAFGREMDDYIRQVRALAPLEGFDRALLPGHIEEERAAQFAEDGIPVGATHARRLVEVAAEFGIDPGFAAP
ncbi:MAG: Ldh family oxidoreductase [Armatimonadota bacterium]